jgi:hypothetical protein
MSVPVSVASKCSPRVVLGRQLSGGGCSRVPSGTSAAEFVTSSVPRHQLSARCVSGVSSPVASVSVGSRLSAYEYRTSPRNVLASMFLKAKRAASATLFARIARQLATLTPVGGRGRDSGVKRSIAFVASSASRQFAGSAGQSRRQVH